MPNPRLDTSSAIEVLFSCPSFIFMIVPSAVLLFSAAVAKRQLNNIIQSARQLAMYRTT
jgi:hypothetical protein